MSDEHGLLDGRIKRWLSTVGSRAWLQPIVSNLARVLAPRHRVGVFVAAFDDDERVLLLRHVLHPAAPWGLPGGWLQHYETPQEAARREFREETGLAVQVGQIAQLELEKEPSHITIVFVGRSGSGDMRLGAEIADYGWFARRQLPAGTAPFVEAAVEAAIRCHRRGAGR